MRNCGMIDSVKLEINKKHIGYTKTGVRLRITEMKKFHDIRGNYSVD